MRAAMSFPRLPPRPRPQDKCKWTTTTMLRTPSRCQRSRRSKVCGKCWLRRADYLFVWKRVYRTPMVTSQEFCLVAVVASERNEKNYKIFFFSVANGQTTITNTTTTTTDDSSTTTTSLTMVDETEGYHRWLKLRRKVKFGQRLCVVMECW